MFKTETYTNISKSGGDSLRNRPKKQPKHDKNAKQTQMAFKEKIQKLSTAKQGYQKQTDELTSAKLDLLNEQKEMGLESQGVQFDFQNFEKTQQEQMAFFEKTAQNNNFKVKAKQPPKQLMEKQDKITKAEGTLANNKDKIRGMVAHISPEAGQKMTSALSHFVNQNDINKEEFAPILKDFGEKEYLTAEDFGKLNEINNAVIEAKKDAPQVQEALQSGEKFGLTPDVMNLLADKEYNQALNPIKDVELETLKETVAAPEAVQQTIQEDAPEVVQKPAVEETVDMEAEPIAMALTEKVKPSFKERLKIGIEKAQTAVEVQYMKLATKYPILAERAESVFGKESTEEKTAVENTIQLDENHEVVLEDTPQKEKVSLNSVLQGQHPQIHADAPKIEGQEVDTVYSIHLDDSLLNAALAQSEKEAYLKQNPDSVETSPNILMDTAEKIKERFHPKNITADKNMTQALEERLEPTIGDELPEVESSMQHQLGDISNIEIEEGPHIPIELDPIR